MTKYNLFVNNNGYNYQSNMYKYGRLHLLVPKDSGACLNFDGEILDILVSLSMNNEKIWFKTITNDYTLYTNIYAKPDLFEIVIPMSINNNQVDPIPLFRDILINKICE